MSIRAYGDVKEPNGARNQRPNYFDSSSDLSAGECVRNSLEAQVGPRDSSALLGEAAQLIVAKGCFAEEQTSGKVADGLQASLKK